MCNLLLLSIVCSTASIRIPLRWLDSLLVFFLLPILPRAGEGQARWTILLGSAQHSHLVVEEVRHPFTCEVWYEGTWKRPSFNDRLFFRAS